MLTYLVQSSELETLPFLERASRPNASHTQGCLDLAEDQVKWNSLIAVVV
jgi:hypothetical protein